ncbi:MAG: penicillin-binding protein 2 [Syntrophomonadaceae bacterium]|nr:penicillin-binding protein 2 [Syntrophomonadaceae bacterium]
MRNRIHLLMGIFLAVFMLLVGILFYHQIIRGEDLTRQAVAMRSREIELKEFPRGTILDRNHRPLTEVSNICAVYCIPEETRRQMINSSGSKTDFNLDNDHIAERITSQLCNCIDGLNRNRLYEQLKKALNNHTSFVRITSNISETEIIRLQQQNIPGVVIAPMTRRYNEEGLAAHIIGYVNGPQGEEGVTGIEKIYNNVLKETPSHQSLVTVVDARGMPIHGLQYKLSRDQEQRGAVVLTIDKTIQQIVETVLDKQNVRGAAVVLSIPDQQVIAMASRPNFNPYRLDQAIVDQSSSLLNRALNPYHPGSLFKLVVTAAALEQNAVKLDDQFICEGGFRFSPDLSIACWKEQGHGKISFAQAFTLSCNPVFIQVALDVGRSNIMHYVHKLHLIENNLTGYGSYKGSRVEINPGRPALANAALGQQGVMLSPLQLTSLVATIASNGKYRTPSIVKYYIDREGRRQNINVPAPRQVIMPATAEKIRSLMEQTVLEGTGKTAYSSKVKVAGKTATSQTGKYLEEKEVLNTWFAGYFPAENPRYAIVILVEEGSSGAASAAPVFKEITEGILKIYVN